MDKMKKTFHIIFPVFLFFVGSVVSKAQNGMSNHLLRSVPQSVYTNPSFLPEANTYVGIPALSSIYFGAGHSGFAYKDLVVRRSDDSLFLDVDNMISKLRQRNYLFVNYNIELLTFGFKVQDNFFSFSATEKITGRFTYPGDLMKLLWKGNSQFLYEPADFSGTGLNYMHYREYALGMNRQIFDNLNIGLRAKLLYGKSNVWTERSHITLSTDPSTFALTAESDIIVNASFPEELFEDDDDAQDFSFEDYILNRDNRGLAFDIGATYNINDKFSVALSVLDIGKINWRSGTRNLVSERASFTFEGIDLKDFFNSDTTAKDGFDILLDSLENTFDFTETENNYSHWMPGIVYLTGMYHLTDNDNIGLLVRSDIFNSRIYPSFTLSYNKRFANVISGVLSYSVANRSYTNVGLGFSLQLGPVQLYAFNDNVYGLFFPTASKNTNIHFGLNLVFGYRIRPPEAPLIY